MDINQCQWHLFTEIEKLYPHLKGKDKMDIEKSIAVWNLWMGTKQWDCWKIWGKYRKEVRSMYFKLRELGNGK
jgi:hypothetical protein